MNHSIRLGPIAVFLAVIAVVLATLAVLTTSTTNADKVLADRYAEVTKARYLLQSRGEEFVSRFDEMSAKGKIDAEVLKLKKTKKGYSKIIHGKGYDLKIEITSGRSADKYKISGWDIKKKWNGEDPYEKVWKGE